MEVPDEVVIVLAGVLGLIFGSFGTVAAYRIPRRESIVSGRSKCPSCGRTIKWYENIPVLSYVLLRGRCANCKTRISPRYPLIELTTGILFALAVARFGVSVEGVIYGGLFWVLVVLTVIDVETKLLPDRVVLPALIVFWVGIAIASYDDDPFGRVSMLFAIAAVLNALAIPALFDLRRRHKREATEEEDVAELPRGIDPWGVLALFLWAAFFVSSILEGATQHVAGAAIGAILVGGFFFSMSFAYPRGMGMGDAKLGLLVGAATGYLLDPHLPLVALFMSFVLGGIGSLLIVTLSGGGRKTKVPFGPFLALGCVVSVFVGDRIADAYLGTF